jgi:transcription initiation factor TFIIIB Brf1 subunit/transcription initiation factor TFIIB
MNRCPYCGSHEIDIAPEHETADHETCFCDDCSWVGFEWELETGPDIRDEAGDIEYHRRVDEGSVAS